MGPNKEKVLKNSMQMEENFIGKIIVFHSRLEEYFVFFFFLKFQEKRHSCSEKTVCLYNKYVG